MLVVLKGKVIFLTVLFCYQVVVQIPGDKPSYGKQSSNTWANRIDLISMAIGYSVGLGNVWRFPSKVLENGGGLFIIPYLVVLAVLGFPMFFMELVLGQYIHYGPVKIFEKMAPICRVSFSLYITDQRNKVPQQLWNHQITKQ